MQHAREWCPYSTSAPGRRRRARARTASADQPSALGGVAEVIRRAGARARAACRRRSARSRAALDDGGSRRHHHHRDDHHRARPRTSSCYCRAAREQAHGANGRMGRQRTLVRRAGGSTRTEGWARGAADRGQLLQPRRAPPAAAACSSARARSGVAASGPAEARVHLERRSARASMTRGSPTPSNVSSQLSAPRSACAQPQPSCARAPPRPSFASRSGEP